MTQWITEKDLIPYENAVPFMEKRIADIRDKQGSAGDELVWLLEHPSLYTAGTSAKDDDLLDSRFPVHKTGRGGEHTYHGPGQRIAYVMLDLKQRQGGKPDIRGYVRLLEEWIIQTLAEFDVKGERREGRVGIWVVMPDGSESKIAAIGVRIRKWVTYHGISINVNPDLSHFEGIVPCGIAEHGVTSLHALGKDVFMEDLDTALKSKFKGVF
ncbi:MAG: lipoate-protein ligase B [Alphaproteobacteria bacterium]|nr:MAG: lipoate-protein ligase B [Alphaproteobacteria bacterium]